MSLTQKLILYALAVALLPVAIVGFTLVRIGEDALRQRIEEHQRTAAAAVAAKVAHGIEELGQRLVTSLQLVEPLRLGQAERQGLLRVLHRQSADITAAVLVDANGGELASPVVQSGDELTGKRLLANMPRPNLEALRPYEVLVSAVYFPARGAARVAVAVPCCADGAEGPPRAMAAVELALSRDVLEIAGIDTGAASRVFIVDGFGRVIAHPSVPVGESLATHAAVAQFLDRREPLVVSHVDKQGEAYQAALAPVGDLGWAVVVEQPQAIAFAPATTMRHRTLSWIAIALVVVLASGLVFAGNLRRRLLALVTGARAFAGGKLETRLDERSSDEIGELAGTMNGMALELARSLEELEEWNRNLESIVQQRTRQLEQTQAQLLMQSKLAALGQLGAGVAHEVNNPLAGIMGYAQLLLRKHPEGDPEHEPVKKIEQAAQRCRNITMSLLRFSQRGLSGRITIEVNKVVREVLELLEGSLREGGVVVSAELGDVGEITADGGQLAIVLINVVANAKNAMPDGGELAVSTAAGDDGVRIIIRDTGHGIENEHLPRVFDPFFTTKKVWTGVGLGLSVAYRIVVDHGGRIELESEVGRGTTVSITLPRKPPPTAGEVDGEKAVLLA